MLEIRGISVAYDGVTAVRNLSLSVADGAIVALIGSNGAGKTTTMKAIIGLKSVSRGEIVFDGERIEGASAPQRVGRGIALSPEGRRVFPQMSVLDNLLVGGYSQRDNRTRRWTRSTAIFPASSSEGARWPVRYRAASSRCWRSAAP